MKAVIIANGSIGNLERWQKEIRQADLLVAADGGATHARALGLQPDLLVGDADSLDRDTWLWLQTLDVALQQHPAAKDETDLELALLQVVEQGAEEILILGALGGRPDQALANVFLLAHPALAGHTVRILGPSYEIRLLRSGEKAIVSGQRGDTLSLLPLTSQAQGIHTRGLRWALSGHSLSFGLARGISNQMTADQAQIGLDKGLLLIIHLPSTIEG